MHACAAMGGTPTSFDMTNQRGISVAWQRLLAPWKWFDAAKDVLLYLEHRKLTCFVQAYGTA